MQDLPEVLTSKVHIGVLPSLYLSATALILGTTRQAFASYSHWFLPYHVEKLIQ